MANGGTSGKAGSALLRCFSGLVPRRPPVPRLHSRLPSRSHFESALAGQIRRLMTDSCRWDYSSRPEHWCRLRFPETSFLHSPAEAAGPFHSYCWNWRERVAGTDVAGGLLLLVVDGLSVECSPQPARAMTESRETILMVFMPGSPLVGASITDPTALRPGRAPENHRQAEHHGTAAANQQPAGFLAGEAGHQPGNGQSNVRIDGV